MKNTEQWSINDANLQSYRGFFLSSQSIMIAVGAIMLNNNYVLTLIISAIAIFQICYVWIPVIYYRTLIVDFYKFNLGERFDSNGDLMNESNQSNLTEKIYCNKPEIRKKVNEHLSINMEKPFKNMRDTRRKIDCTLPISMLLIWMIFIFESIIKLFV